jgi:hypothetical protein
VAAAADHMSPLRMKTVAIILLFMPLFAADTQAGVQDRLEACRHQIDALDQSLVELIQNRAQVVQQVGASGNAKLGGGAQRDQD